MSPAIHRTVQGWARCLLALAVLGTWVVAGHAGPSTAELVKDVRPGPTGSFPDDLTSLAGVVYFAAGDGVSGEELWRSDGTEAGTVMVADIEPGANDSNPADLVSAAGSLFAYDPGFLGGVFVGGSPS